jgi:S-disulfanyl-L-cysteine oxidoreductase SoxD
MTMRTVYIAAIGMVVSTTTLRAQQPPSSTASGVYSEEQATRGRDVYLGACKSCHTPESHTGALFKSKWEGRALADLFAYISAEMPKNDPGGLSPQENADVLAYLLKLNRMPPGPSDMSADSTALRSIRIESPITVRKDP